jgi:hypothetical protein
MRKVLFAAAIAVATSVVPIQSASAFCVTAYYQVTGRCSPCNDVGAVLQNLHDKYGVPETGTQCLA